MKIQLPDFIIADLYKDSLVVLNEAAVQTREEPGIAAINEDEKPFYFGDNTQHICIVLNNTTHVVADDASLQLLSNLLAALNYTLADAAIINHYRTPVIYS